MAKSNFKKLSADQGKKLIGPLKTRFEKHMSRHKGLSWAAVLSRLESAPEKLWSLHEMEMTGGEPDVISWDKKSGECLFVDCSVESPKDRRSLCYDREGLDSRKEFKPADTAMDMARAMGIDMLNEEQYRLLQSVGDFDLKTSSWLLTPAPIRKLGGAIFGDKRYGQVFIYHNGAGSYYAARGFRGALKV